MCFNRDFSSGLGNPYGDCFDNLSFSSVYNSDVAGNDLGQNNAWDGSLWNLEIIRPLNSLLYVVLMVNY